MKQKSEKYLREIKMEKEKVQENGFLHFFPIKLSIFF